MENKQAENAFKDTIKAVTGNKQTNIERLKLYFIGFFMGTADIIPGVSGGTIAFIFGIYKQLVDSIKLVTGHTLKLVLKAKFREAVLSVPYNFLLPLAFGILSAVFLMAGLVHFLLSNYPEHVWGFFFGLVLASIFIVFKTVGKWTWGNILGFLVASIITFFVVGTVPVETPNNPLMLFFSGAIAICAMILPGISGSYILLVLGQYSLILEAVLQRDLLSLGIFVAGCAFGISLFARLLSWLFANYKDIALAVLTGIMLGSLRKIWPWKEVLQTTIDRHGEVITLVDQNILPNFSSQSSYIVILLAIIGFGLMIIINNLQSRKVRF